MNKFDQVSSDKTFHADEDVSDGDDAADDDDVDEFYSTENDEELTSAQKQR